MNTIQLNGVLPGILAQTPGSGGGDQGGGDTGQGGAEEGGHPINVPTFPPPNVEPPPDYTWIIEDEVPSSE